MIEHSSRGKSPMLDKLDNPVLKRQIMDELGYTEDGLNPVAGLVRRALERLIADRDYGPAVERKIRREYPVLKDVLDSRDEGR